MHLVFIKKAIMGKVEREVKYRLALGVLGIIMLIALLVAPIIAPIENMDKRHSGSTAKPVKYCQSIFVESRSLKS